MAGDRKTSGDSSDEDSSTVWNAVGQHAGYGMTIAASLGFFLAVGWWIDSRLGTTPLLMIVGALGGAGAGFYSMYRSLVIEPRERGARGETGGPRADREGDG